MLMQAVEAAQAAVKGKCSKLLGDASTLADKLRSERAYSRSIEVQLRENSALLSTQQQRTRKALKIMRDAQAYEEHACNTLATTSGRQPHKLHQRSAHLHDAADPSWFRNVHPDIGVWLQRQVA